MIIGYYDMEVFIIATNIKKVKKPDVESYTLHTSIRQTPTNQIERMDIYNLSLYANRVKRTSATVATGVTKMGAGLMDIMEFIGDGELWALGKVFEGHTYALAQGIEAVSPAASNALMDVRENVKEWIRDDIAFDITNTLEDELFNSELGSRLTSRSYMKRDSKAAEGIEKITRFGGEVGIATAATVASGGTASPVLISTLGLGFADGAGEKANKTYKDAVGTTSAKEASIFFSGLSKSAQWYAYGRLGQGIMNVGGEVGEAVAHGPYDGRWNTPSNLGEAWGKLRSSVNPADTEHLVSNAAKEGLIGKDNVVDMFNGVFSEISDGIDKGRSVSETANRVLVDGIAVNFMFNGALDGFQIYGDSMKSMKHFAPTLDGKVKSLIKPILNSLDASEDSGIIDLGMYDNIRKVFN